MIVKSLVAESSVSVDGTKVVEYVFRCCANLKGEFTLWDVRRQFRDFTKLHAHLKRVGNVYAEFPANSLLLSIGESMLGRKREAVLKDYLNAVLHHCNDDQCALLCKFLKVNKVKNLMSNSVTDLCEQDLDTGHTVDGTSRQDSPGKHHFRKMWANCA